MRLRHLLGIIFFCTITFLTYTLRPSRGYVGLYNDDAGYLLTAQSVLEGRYQSLWTPTPEVIQRLSPGYPLFLAPFVKLLRPHWGYFPFISAGLVVLSCLFLGQLSTYYLTPLSTLLLCSCFAFHPLTVTLSTAVMSEPLFLALILLYFLLLYRLRQRTGVGRILLQGLLLAWLMLIKPTGGILIIPTLFAFKRKQRWRIAVPVTLIALLAALPFPLWIYGKTGTPTDYLQFWRSEVPLLQSDLLSHIHRINYFIFCENLFGLRLPHKGIYLPTTLLPIGIGLYLCYRGYRAALKRNPMEKPFVAAVGVFFLLYWGVHTLWLSIDLRYFYPILPFVLFFFILGVQSVLEPHFKNKRVWIGLALIWTGCFMSETALAWGQPAPSMPGETFQWARDHIPSNDMVLGIEPLLYLYTGKRGVTTIQAVDSEDFRFQLLDRRISYIVLLPFRANMPLAARESDFKLIMAKDRLWTERNKGFKRVYVNEREESEVYRVLEDAAFQNAYRLYVEGVQDLQQSRFSEAAAKLRSSLKLDDGISSTWTALGLIDYVRKDYGRAEQKFKRALAIEPYNVLASLHLARIYTFQHQPELARYYYAETKRNIDESGTYEEMRSVTLQEAADAQR